MDLQPRQKSLNERRIRSTYLPIKQWLASMTTVIEMMLRPDAHSGNDAVAYADDIAIAAFGICPQTLSYKLN